MRQNSQKRWETRQKITYGSPAESAVDFFSQVSTLAVSTVGLPEEVNQAQVKKTRIGHTRGPSECTRTKKHPTRTGHQEAPGG